LTIDNNFHELIRYTCLPDNSIGSVAILIIAPQFSGPRDADGHQQQSGGQHEDQDGF